MDYKVNLYVKWKNELAPTTVDAHKAIDPAKEIEFQSVAADTLDPGVGKQTVTLTHTWKYEDENGVEKTIPGSFTSTHTVYRVVDKPQAPWDIAAPETRPWVAALDYAVTLDYLGTVTDYLSFCRSA